MEIQPRDIERSDFRQVRRGWDPDEVMLHLSAVAQTVEEMKNAPRQEPTLAGAAAARVESIIAAAEASAREIEEKASADARATRDQAERDAAERVKAAEEMVASLVSRAEQLKAEVDDFATRVGGLKGAIDAVRRDFDSVAPALPPTQAIEPVAVEPPAPEPAEPEQPAEPERAAPQAPRPQPRAAASGDSAEGARLIALNMALSGASREETARYLQENFELDDADQLLDEVYARVGS